MRSDDSLHGIRPRWHIVVGSGMDRARRLKAACMQQDRFGRCDGDHLSCHCGVCRKWHGDEPDPCTGEARLEIRRDVKVSPARLVGIRSARSVSANGGSATDEGLCDGTADHSKSDDRDRGAG
jgi:hypothetical protein